MKPTVGFGPQAWLSFAFFLLGLGSLLGLTVWLAVDPAVATMTVRMPQPLAFVHLAILGWMASFVFGAAYQLIPVIAETPLWSRSAAWVHCGLHTLAAPMLIRKLAVGDFGGAGHWGGLVALGAAVAVTNLWMTANRRSRWTPENVGLVLALFWLVVAVSLGVLLALARLGRGWGIDAAVLLQLHLTCGLAGFFVGTLVAVSFKLVPMFLLSTVATRWRQWLAIGLLAIAPMALVSGLTGGHAVAVWLAGVAFGGAVAAFLAEVVALVKRRLRAPDWPLRTYLVGVGMLVPATVAGLAALLGSEGRGLPQRPAVAVFALVVLGVLTPCTLGMAGKIVPFLAWQWRYAPHLGRARVPVVADLFRPALLRVQFFAVASASLLLGVGVWIGAAGCLRLAAVGLLLGALTLAFNVAGLIPHLLHPRLEPLANAPRPAASVGSFPP